MTDDTRQDLTAAVEAHTALFNSCVGSGDWAPFVATFTEDASMTLTNAPGGPDAGRAGIARMYAARPPTDTMSLLEVVPVGDDMVRVGLAWESGRRSTMVVRWRGHLVCSVELTL
jgi:hypothetical protein